MNNRRIQRRSTRRSVFFPRPPGQDLSEIESAHYADMFSEDVSMLLPGFDEASRAIRLEPQDPAIEQLIEEAVHIHHYGAGVSAAVSEFIRLAARRVAGYGSAFYEITFETPTGEVKPDQFHFQAIDPESIRAKRGELYQYIHHSVAKERNVSQRIHIPKEYLLKLSPPKGWQREFRKISYGLTTLSKVLIPEFAYPKAPGDPNTIPIDTMQYLKTQELAVLAVTKRAGWNARGTSSGKISGYYWFRRWLRFEKLKIELRTSLIECLNDGLRRVGTKLGFSNQIVVSGLPTLADIASGENELQNGSRILGEITKPFLRV